jgi:hypothetical protein
MKRDPKICKHDGCTRAVAKLGDLVCSAHWRLVPRDLRQILIREQYKRESKEKKERVVAAAGLVLAYLETCKIILPQETP